MKLGFAGLVLAALLAATGCKTYEVTVLDRATGKPPAEATVSFNYSGMLMVGKAFSGLLEVDADGHAQGSIGSPNAPKDVLSVHVYLADFATVQAEFDDQQPGQSIRVPHAYFQARTPESGERTIATLENPQYVDEFWQNLAVWVERK